MPDSPEPTPIMMIERQRHPHPSKLRRFLRALGMTIVIIYAVIGFALSTAFFALRSGLTNVGGVADTQSATFNEVAKQAQSAAIASPLSSDGPHTSEATPSEYQVIEQQQFCRADVVGSVSPRTAHIIMSTYATQKSLPLLLNMVQAAAFRIQSQPVVLANLNACSQPSQYGSYTADALLSKYTSSDGTSIYPWATTAEWATITTAVTKDLPTMNSASSISGVPAREIMAVCLVEQLRLYFTQRELFEKVFQPLSVLSSATKSAWGVMAIKEATAIQIEQHLQDTTSPYYIGADKAHLLDFTTTDQTTERYNRLTNEKDHTYSYLYGGLFLAQVEKQWGSAGYDIANRPEILATLFNVGFEHSQPKNDPQVGGSTLTIASTDYTFGALAYELYYSGELQNIFPYSN